MHSVFSLTVRYSICPSTLPKLSISAVTHVSSVRTESFITRERPSSPKPAPLDDTSHQHHQQLAGCERKLCLIPSWNKQMLQKEPAAASTEGSFLSGGNPCHPTPLGQLSLGAVRRELRQQV